LVKAALAEPKCFPLKKSHRLTPPKNCPTEKRKATASFTTYAQPLVAREAASKTVPKAEEEAPVFDVLEAAEAAEEQGVAPVVDGPRG
jgi:hypothetical protein